MLALGFASFLCFGTVLVLVGANQADLARELGLDLSRSGLLGSALALGIGFGVVAGGRLFDRAPRRPVFAAAAALAGAALLAVDAAMSFGRAFALVWGAGAGIGAYSMMINGSVVERFAERSARPMALVHAGATLGAVLGAPFAGWLAARQHWTASFHAIGAAHLLLAAAALRIPFPRRAPAPPPAGGMARPVLSHALLPFAWIAFAYIGVEATLTIFALPYASGALGLPEERGRVAISAFWLGLFTGRLAALVPRWPLDERALIVCGALGCAALGAGIGSGSRHVELVFAGAGAALGCVYPVLIATVGQRFPRARGTAQGLAAGAGALGGFSVPWLTGGLGDALGIAAALQSLAGWSLAVALCAALARRGRAL